MLTTARSFPLGSLIAQRAGWFVALAGTVAWALAFALARETGVADEVTHFEAIRHLAWGHWQLPSTLAMFPGYHWMVYAAAFGEPTLLSARLFSVVMAIVAFFIFALSWEKLHGSSSSLPTLLLATLPILQPFTAMAYTDITGVAFLLAAWAAQLSQRTFAAAALLAVACIVRQTNLVWGGFFAAWEALQVWSMGLDFRSAFKEWIRRVGWLAMLLVFAVGFALSAGSVLPAPIPENRPKPNIATLHLAALLWMLLLPPVWIAQARHAGQWIATTARERPALLVAGTLACAAAVALFALTYQNPHPWNRPVAYWQPYHLTFIRNWPLVELEHSAALRWISGGLIVAAALSAWNLIASQRLWRETALAAAFGVILLTPHFLVDPRYFITPAVFLLLFVEFEERQARALAGWWIALCVVFAPFILAGRAIW